MARKNKVGDSSVDGPVVQADSINGDVRTGGTGIGTVNGNVTGTVINDATGPINLGSGSQNIYHGPVVES